MSLRSLIRHATASWRFVAGGVCVAIVLVLAGPGPWGVSRARAQKPADAAKAVIPHLASYETDARHAVPGRGCIADASGWLLYRSACVAANEQHRAVCTQWCGGTANGSVKRWTPVSSDPAQAHCVEKHLSHGEPKVTAIYRCRVAGTCTC